MRLICPGCGAQYEVDDSVIPDAGRDVQCSACGHVWFQKSRPMLLSEGAAVALPFGDWGQTEVSAADAPTLAAANTPAALRSAPTASAPAPSAVAMPAAAPALVRTGPPRNAPLAAQARAAEAWSGPSGPGKARSSGATSPGATSAAAFPAPVPPGEEEDEDSDVGLSAAPPAGAMPRRALDDGLLSILREEAAREAQARRVDGAAFETQQDMNLEQVRTAPVLRALEKLTASAATAQPRPPRLLTGASILSPTVATPDPTASPDPSRADGPSRTNGQDTSPDPLEQASMRLGQARTGAAEPPETGKAEAVRPAATKATPATDADPLADRLAAEQISATREHAALPDISAVNASLRASADRPGDAAAREAPQVIARQRSGFRTGFAAMLLAAALATALYGFAPRLSSALPDLAAALDTYVGAVDSGRAWLNGTLHQLIAGFQAAQRG